MKCIFKICISTLLCFPISIILVFLLICLMICQFSGCNKDPFVWFMENVVERWRNW